MRWDRIAAMERETGSCADASGRRGAHAMGIKKGWHTPGFWPVFPSLCDPFDNEVPEYWRRDFFALIGATPHLTWLLLTKRIGNAAKMLEGFNPDGSGLLRDNVWLGASVVNQEEADRDLPKLLAVPAVKRFVSYEPALGPVTFTRYFEYETDNNGPIYQGIDWVIIGGESSQGGLMGRPFNVAWARSTIKECKDAGVACFVKQLGSFTKDDEGKVWARPYGGDRAGAKPEEWPADIRVQQFPMERTAA